MAQFAGDAPDAADVSAVVRQLKSGVRGDVIDAADPGYDGARRVWNAMYDDCRPAAVVRCADEDAVAATVRILRQVGLEIRVAVRGGGHHIAGFGVCDGGVVIDLSRLRRAVALDDRMLVAGGATLHEVDVAGAAVSRAVPVGVVSETGLAGLALSGGVGWLTRMRGYTCDSLVRARVVTADGEVITADEAENADLLWGLRGGGGNFGIVTEFEFASYDQGPVVVGEAYHLIRSEAQAEDVLRFYRDWTATLPREATVWLTIEQVNEDHELLWPEHRGELAAGLLACSAGPSLDLGERLLLPMARELKPAAARVTRMPLVDLQHLQDNSNAAARGMRSYMKGEMVTHLSDAMIAGIARECRRMPTQNTLFEMGQLGGALGDRTDADAAVGLRGAEYLAGFSLMSRDRDHEAENIAWVRRAWKTLLDASAGGTYLNFSGDEGERRVLESLAAHAGAKRSRLIGLKLKYDPTNFFRVNHNIKPADEAS
jgi:hypothetical protein